MEPTKENQHLWDQFIRLGERIGDGDLDASESRWMNKEYKNLSRILIPELKEKDKAARKNRATIIDDSMNKLLETNFCKCGGKLKQSRSGSKICYCELCNMRYRASGRKKE